MPVCASLQSPDHSTGLQPFAGLPQCVASAPKVEMLFSCLFVHNEFVLSMQGSGMHSHGFFIPNVFYYLFGACSVQSAFSALPMYSVCSGAFMNASATAIQCSSKDNRTNCVFFCFEHAEKS